MDYQAIFITLLQVVIYIGIAPGVVGTLHWMSSRMQGRQGPWPHQPYLDIWKLLHRRPVIPETASWIYSTAPWVVFSCYSVLGVLTPVIFLAPKTANNLVFSWPVGDLLLLIYLLGLAHFVVGIAGMDAGAPFGDLGSSREMFLHFLSEPPLILSIYALTLKAHTTSFPAVLHQLQEKHLGLLLDPAIWLILLALGIAALIEAGRMPFENPETHLELTMIGKAVHLEYAGFYLALLEWADAMKLTFLIILLSDLALPWTLVVLDAGPLSSTFLNAMVFLLFPVKLLAAISLLALWELTRGKLRLRAVVRPATLAVLFSILAVVFVILFQ